MNSDDQKSRGGSAKTGKAREKVHQVTDRDVIKKTQSPLPKEEMNPPLTAPRRNDGLMTQSPQSPKQ